MRAKAPPSPDELAELFGRYDVGRPCRGCRPASHGIENSNYFIATVKDGVESEWVLTVLEQPSHSGPGYVPLLDHCLAAGLPVAPAVRNARGEAVETLRGKPAMLAPKLPGEHVEQPTLAQIETLGGFLAEFHGATANLSFDMPPYPRDQHWIEQRAATVRDRLPTADEHLLADAAARVRLLLDSPKTRELPAGAVHGDLFRDNLLFNGAALTGVLDFHHAAHGPLIYDLAVTVNDWCNRAGGLLERERAAALVGAYHRIRPLTDAETRLFPGFLLYAGLAFWLSRLTVALGTPGVAASRAKDPDEFKDIVANRFAEPFEFNPR